MFRSNVLVCGGTGCTSSNSEQIIDKLNEEIKAQGLDKEVNVIRTGCFGLCALGPIMVVYPFLQKYFVKGVLIGAVKM